MSVASVCYKSNFEQAFGQVSELTVASSATNGAESGDYELFSLNSIVFDWSQQANCLRPHG